MPRDGQGAEALAGLRVVYFGMGGVFSRAPLEALLRAGADLRAVVEPAPAEALAGTSPSAPLIRLEASRWAASGAARRGLTLAGGGTGRSLREIAAQAGAPAYHVQRLGDPATLAELAALQPDALAVACFPRRLPPALLALPRLGALNAHPSALPALRGPDPLFWAFHSGGTETAVTIHLMDAGLDTGPILLQRPVPIAAGEAETALEARLAALAGDLLVEALSGLAGGSLTPQPQDESRASYQPWPTAADYAVDATWSARRAWVFARGIAGRGQPIILTARDGARFRLIEALDGATGATLDTPWRMDGDRLALALTDGVLTCRAERLENGV